MAPACAPSSALPGGERHATAALQPCFVEGTRAPARCGKVRVFEDRLEKKGRTLDLQVVVIPALASAPTEDPVFFLAGGPGQAATSIAGFMLGVADRLHDKRDLVFVDQRGTGWSHPLYCEQAPPDAPLAEMFDAEFDPDGVDLCRASQDADLTKYTTAIAADDLDDVRAALGYDRINLWGTSYGTRLGLAYMRAHGDRTRSVVLDSVAPMSLYLPLSIARDAERALDKLLADCAAEKGCSAAFPDLAARFRAFVSALDDEPIRARVAHPTTGRLEDVVIGRTAFLSGLRGLLYSADLSSLVPLALDRAMKGDLGPYVALARGLTGKMEGSMAMGLFLSVVCSEDVPFFTDAEIARQSDGTLFGAEIARETVRGCARWPRADVPKSFRDPVQSDVPVLLLSGDLDPVTPPSWAEDAKKTLPHGVTVVIPGTGHTAAVSACARKIATAFVSAGTEVGLDTSCSQKGLRPPFFTTFAGAP